MNCKNCELLEAKVVKLRTAFADFAGASTKEDLKGMKESHHKLAGVIPHQDFIIIDKALDALIETAEE